MWELVVELLLPSRRVKEIEPAEEQAASGTLRIEVARPEALRRSLNVSGWLADEVIAAGIVRQGRAQSLFRMMTGLALLEVLRPRRSKALPREFALAVTADRVVALAVNPWKESAGETVVAVKVKREERGSWPRGTVRMEDVSRGWFWDGATLDIAGGERFPVTWEGDPSDDDLVEPLGR